MGIFDAFRYDGKHALVVGGATGMGAATARLALDAGARLTVMDRAEIDVVPAEEHPPRPGGPLVDRRSSRTGGRHGRRIVLVRRGRGRNARISTRSTSSGIAT